MTSTQTSGRPFGVAIVGCGYVADYYMATLPLHSGLHLVGVTDINVDRLTAFCAHHGVTPFDDLDALLADERVDIVVNLTNPRSHAGVSRQAIEAGKHVYSEKPIAMEIDEAKELVALAEQRGVLLSGAPCSLLGETAQTVWRAVRDGVVGTPRLVYAEMDEGMVFRMRHDRWRSASGAPWPSRDEFEVGTTIEHAGYVVSWLPAMFGSAVSVSGFSTCVFPDKGTAAAPLPVESPDLAVACITFESGVVARLTCSLVAKHDHSLRVVGDTGELEVDDTWYYTSPVKVRRWLDVRGRHIEQPWRERISLVGRGQSYSYRGTQQMDFARGVADLAAAARDGRLPTLSAAYSLHVNEIVLAVSNHLKGGATYAMTTKIDTPPPPPSGPRRRRDLRHVATRWARSFITERT